MMLEMEGISKKKEEKEEKVRVHALSEGDQIIN